MKNIIYIFILLLLGCNHTKTPIKVEQPMQFSKSVVSMDQVKDDALKITNDLQGINAGLQSIVANPQGTQADALFLDNEVDNWNAEILEILNSIKVLKGVLPDEPEGTIGFGKNTTGGEGYLTVYVTNLNNSGSGSLRSALSQGNRTVVVQVSGTINLTDKIDIEKGNITIEGNGVMLAKYGIQVEASNVIIDGFHVDLTGNPSQDDAISIRAYSGKNLENIIVQNSCFIGGTDENFNISTVGSGTVKNVSVNGNIMADATKNFLIMDSVTRVSVLGNLMVNNSERHIRCNSDPQNDISFEMINNALVDFRYGTQVNMGVKFSAVGNHYTTNRASTSKAIEGVASAFDSQTHAYITGNKFEGIGSFNSRIAPYVKTTPFATSGIVPQELTDKLNLQVGCGHPNDQGLIAQY